MRRRCLLIALLSSAALLGGLAAEPVDLLTPDFTLLVDGREVATPDWLLAPRFSRAVARAAAEVGREIVDESPAETLECELRRPQTSASALEATAVAGAKRSAVPVPAGLYAARVLVESDFEFFKKWGGSVEAVTARIVAILAEVSGILEQEIGVRLEIGHIGVLTAKSDLPWWNNPFGQSGFDWPAYTAAHPLRAFPRTFVHVFSGFNTGGGSLNGLCTGADETPDDLSGSWQNPMIAAHEIGHILGSDHTHCYGVPQPTYGNDVDFSHSRGPIGLPPVDRCRGWEEWCYQGVQVAQPTGESSIMSYCASTARSYGAPGRYGDRSERVLAVMRGSVERADGLYPGCLRTLTDALRLRVESATVGKATLAWDDIFPNETGWTLEQLAGKKWKAVKKLPAGATRVGLTGPSAKPGATYRLIARFKGNSSEPSVPVTVAAP